MDDIYVNYADGVRGDHHDYDDNAGDDHDDNNGSYDHYNNGDNHHYKP